MTRKSRAYMCVLFLLLLVSLLVLLKECSNSGILETPTPSDSSESFTPSVQSEHRDSVVYDEIAAIPDETSSDFPMGFKVSTSEEADSAEIPGKTPVETSAAVQERIDKLQAEIANLEAYLAERYGETVVDSIAVIDTVTDTVIDTVTDTVAVAEDLSSVEVSDTTDLQFSIKTNLVGLGMGITNLAFEIDFAEHWSLNVPLYYSAWDYIGTQTKFRTFTMQPELRYWFNKYNEGFFAGLHFGLSYYNVAFGGDYRYQDHYMETPAIGGGLAFGYRMPISRNRRWKLEFSLGAGVYDLYYDRFYNTPDYKEGLLVDSISTTYWGIDQVSISFLYSFDLRKKGGRK